MSDPDYWLILGRRVHHSRLIIIRDNLPPTLLRPAYNFLGIPQAQILWDYVLHWNRARVAVAGILEKLNLLVYQTNTEDLLTSSDGVQQMDAKMLALSRYRNNDSVVVCDRNAEDIKNITLTISGVTDIVRQQLEFIAAINRTPAVKLLGISPSGFNATGESDIRNYYDHVMSKQELLRDGVQKILDIIQLTTTGTIDQSISFEFNALGADDDQADVQTAAARVNMLNSLLQTNVLSAEEVRKAVKEDKKTKLGFIPDDLPRPNTGAEVGTAEDLAEDPAIKSLWMLGEPEQKTAAEPEIDQNVIANWMVEHESDAPQA
jgi:phage-related protein (TIGR01555 family)